MANEKIEKICANCELATPIGNTDACLCSKNGTVKARGYCRRFKPDLLKVVPLPPKKINSDNEIFEI